MREVMGEVAREVALARGRANGARSGRTMVIMANAVKALSARAATRTLRWRRLSLVVATVGGVLVASLSAVIWFQQQRIERMVAEKLALDAQISALNLQMAEESDPGRLRDLEERLQLLMGKASEKIDQVRSASRPRADALEKPTDELDQEIRKILRSFDAETYAIPPIFRQALEEQRSRLLAGAGLEAMLARKKRYWPTIRAALAAKQLPEELGYIAYVESGFEPGALNARSHAAGMWQLMDETAHACGLRVTVESSGDERFDAHRSSEGAACYLSKLLVEFGEQSFMLAMASYNRGENGVRRALHQVAREPGGYRRRDFWHLYRMKLLPAETRDYVPRVLAAALVLGSPEKYGLVTPK